MEFSLKTLVILFVLLIAAVLIITLISKQFSTGNDAVNGIVKYFGDLLGQ